MKTFTLLIAILFAVCLNNDYAQNTWTQKANFGGATRGGAVAFSIGSKGYLGTGYNGAYRIDFWEYDPAANTWTQKADFGGTVRFYAAYFSIGSKGYLGTGYNNGTEYKDFWEYDPAANTWTRKADFGGTARHGAVGFSIGGKGYIGTGNTGSYEKDFWEYDPATDTWIQKADFGGDPRVYARGFSIGSKGYLGTGTAGSFFQETGTVGSLYKDFWEYDPGTNTWTQKADFGGGFRNATVGLSIGSKGYMGTGYDGSYYKDFWEYDPGTNTWTRKADFGGIARYDAVGFSIGGKGYLGTGSQQLPNYYKDFWEYTPDNLCTAPTGMKVQDISDTAAILKWQVAGGAILHVRVRYRIEGGTAWVIKNKNGANPMVHINELFPNTTYQWQLRSFCAADTSGWIAGPDFTTLASFAFSSTISAAITSGKLAGKIHLQIMPNPNKGNFTIQLQLPAKAAITTLTLYNNIGERIWQQDAGKISGAVSRNIALESKLSTGVYVLMIRHGDSRLMQKVMVTK